MGGEGAYMSGKVGLVLPLLLLWSVGSQGVGSAAGGGERSSWGVGPGTFSGAEGPSILSRTPQCCRPLMLRGGAPTRAAEPDNNEDQDLEEEEEEQIPWVRLRLHNACFGKSDFFDVVVDSDMLVRDFKRELHRNFTASMCEPEQMEVWCRGKEMVGMTSDQLSDYGVEPGGSEEGFFAVAVKQKYIHTEAGDGAKGNDQVMGPEGIQALLQSPMMQQLLANPPLLQQVIENNPQFKQLLAANPELKQILEDPVLLRKALQGGPPGYDDEYNEEGTPINPHERDDRRSQQTPEQASLMRVRRVSQIDNDGEREMQMESLTDMERGTVMRLRHRIETERRGWDKNRLREALGKNTTLAGQYSELFRQYGSVDGIRGNISASEELTERYKTLATTLSCAYAPPAPASSPKEGNPEPQFVSNDLLQDALRSAYDHDEQDVMDQGAGASPMSLPSALGRHDGRSLADVEGVQGVGQGLDAQRATEELTKLSPEVLQEVMSLVNEIGPDALNDPAKIHELEQRLSTRPDLSKALMDLLQASEAPIPSPSPPPHSLPVPVPAPSIQESPPGGIQQATEAPSRSSQSAVSGGSSPDISRKGSQPALSGSEARAKGTALIKSGDQAMKRRDFAQAASDFDAARDFLMTTEGPSSPTVTKLSGLAKAARAKAEELAGPPQEDQEGEGGDGGEGDGGGGGWVPPPPPAEVPRGYSWEPNPPDSGMNDDEWRRFRTCQLWVESKIGAIHMARQILQADLGEGDEEVLPGIAQVKYYAELNETHYEEMLKGNVELCYDEMEEEEAALADKPEPEPELAPPVAELSLEDKYGERVQQLVDMGFADQDANLRALVDTGGNVEAAVSKLLGQ